jgi:hypothetical protein
VGDKSPCPECKADNVVLSKEPVSATALDDLKSAATHQDYPALTLFQHAFVLAGFVLGNDSFDGCLVTSQFSESPARRMRRATNASM